MKQIFLFILSTWLLSPSAWAALSCHELINAPENNSLLIKHEKNARWKGVTGFIIVEDGSNDKSPLSVSRATSIGAQISRLFKPGVLAEQSILEITLTDDIDRFQSAYAVEGTGARVSVSKNLFNAQGLLNISIQPGTLELSNANGKAYDGRKVGQQLHLSNVTSKDIFIGGLVSISAEPPEGFFAASTQSEMANRGWSLKPAAEATTWLYRVPDAREENVFAFTFPSVDRRVDTPSTNKFKIAVGSGVAHDPASPGLKEANLLWLGDEQHGAIDSFLKVIGRGSYTLNDLKSFAGFVLKASRHKVILGQVDKVNALTKQGFSEMETSPELYRKVFSSEYDSYLSTLFQENGKKESSLSYLLATSRGCSQGCAICCSGGLSTFQYFTADRIMKEFNKIRSHANTNDVIDIYFVDSNFNNNPERIIELAKLYKDSPHWGRFRFYCRHNTLNGFLKPNGKGEKEVNLELIAAYKTLGLNEIMMGIDSYDNASTLTLKTSRLKLVKTETDTRPTYTFSETFKVIEAMEKAGVRSRGFVLGNNPWVSDLDRIDSYFNIFNLWARNANFSLDARSKAVAQLKPFAGSPIGDAARNDWSRLVKEDRFKTDGPLGELDEAFNFTVFNSARAQIGLEPAVQEMQRMNLLLETRILAVLKNSKSTLQDKKLAQLALGKLITRESEIESLVATAQNGKPFLQEIRNRKAQYSGLANFSSGEQKQLFIDSASQLFDSLKGGK